ncbi:MAG: glutamyl-tRNA reductase [Actinomycetota bacterium]|nr:glutamyl-tRNA reductase [Actinomycetota bacterium]MEC7579852.1 glutamyl-tRNA reductase [Actinomycetota bacterium]MEC8464682.1 glutamyl-tRNA reductase [Actinomycetota bacterium]MEC8486677.1 glutamyl-tRNA reductase [Actinomycetota bacterium]MEC8520929.1 glutamyl-tRNA reductase [Actinomycetota bacterium]
MSVLVVGVNHRTAPLDLLERIALDAQGVAKAVSGLVALDSVREAVVLSTCNRTEVYAVAELFHQGFDDIQHFLATTAGVDLETINSHTYAEHDDAAAHHLFSVAAGLDSMVLGEGEVLGQVRDAWEIAQAEGAARSTLNLLFRHCLETGKRARTETDIARGTASMSHAAVEMAVDYLGSLDNVSVAVVGAGLMGEGIAVALHGHGARRMTVLNRTEEHGRSIADRVDGTVQPLAALDHALVESDLIISCTSAQEPIITTDMARPASSPDRPTLIIDIAVPRDVHHEVAQLSDVTVLNLDDLQRWAARGREARTSSVEAVRTIISEELDRYAIASSAVQAAPLISALRSHFDSIRRDELDRVAGRLDEDARNALDVVTTQLLAKLLHEPSVRLRLEAGSPRGERLSSAVIDLFNLDDPHAGDA